MLALKQVKFGLINVCGLSKNNYLKLCKVKQNHVGNKINNNWHINEDAVF